MLIEKYKVEVILCCKENKKYIGTIRYNYLMGLKDSIRKKFPQVSNMKDDDIITTLIKVIRDDTKKANKFWSWKNFMAFYWRTYIKYKYRIKKT